MLNDKEIQEYIKWRRSEVKKARSLCEHNFAKFFANRLAFQRQNRKLETQDMGIFSNPEAAAIDNFFLIMTEEGDMWTNDEIEQARKVIAAFISLNYGLLKKDSPHFWTNPDYNPVDHNYFEGRTIVNLSPNQMQALAEISRRAGQNIDMTQTSFPKPKKHE